jgi:hypothetical protein
MFLLPKLQNVYENRTGKLVACNSVMLVAPRAYGSGLEGVGGGGGVYI